MRDLSEWFGEKVEVTGTFQWIRHSARDTMLLLSDIYIAGEYVVDHIHVDSKKKFPPGLKQGDRITFRGKPRYYYRIDGTQDMTFEVLKVLRVE